MLSFFFFFNDTATTEIYTLSLHDALPILPPCAGLAASRCRARPLDRALVRRAAWWYGKAGFRGRARHHSRLCLSARARGRAGRRGRVAGRSALNVRTNLTAATHQLVLPNE